MEVEDSNDGVDVNYKGTIVLANEGISSQVGF